MQQQHEMQTTQRDLRGETLLCSVVEVQVICNWLYYMSRAG